MSVRKIRVSAAFIKQRDANAKKYVSRGRSPEKMRIDCQHELYEFDKVHKGEWKSGDSWKVDGIDPTYGRIEVKNCPGPYLFTPNAQKTAVQRQQIGHVENFCAVKLLGDASRLLKVGDIVEIEELGYFPFEDTMNRMMPSGYNTGHYIRLDTLDSSTAIKGIIKPKTNYSRKRKEVAELFGCTQKQASAIMKFHNQQLKEV